MRSTVLGRVGPGEPDHHSSQMGRPTLGVWVTRLIIKWCSLMCFPSVLPPARAMVLMAFGARGFDGAGGG